MKIAIIFKGENLNGREVIKSETEKSLEELKKELFDECIVTSDTVIKSSEVIYIKKVEDEKMHLKSIPTEDLVNELIGRPLSYEEMYHYRKLLNIGIGNHHLK